MTHPHPTIVVPAYNRPIGLRRLLASLSRAHLPSTVIPLVISCDGGASDEVIALARSFDDGRYDCTVITRDENLGLKAHLLWCGDQSERTGAAIVLEDDLQVDPWFYQFACAALDHYHDDERIAQIALYAPRYHDGALLPFEALRDDRSTFFMQLACSWGQAWSHKRWQDFRTWLDGIEADGDPDQALSSIHDLPDDIRAWPSHSSWKKFFQAYLCTHDRTVVYPFESLTTNCADPGGIHLALGSELYQVPLPSPDRVEPRYDFAALDTARIIYDASMEAQHPWIYERLDLTPDEVTIDLYGNKPRRLLSARPYLLTSRRTGAPVLRSFPLAAKPIEANLASPLSPDHQHAGDIHLVESSRIDQSARPPYPRLARTQSYLDIDSHRLLIHHLAAVARKCLRAARNRFHTIVRRMF